MSTRETELNKSEHHSNVPATDGVSAVRSIRLLLVEDQPEYALLLRRWLSRARVANFAVQQAGWLKEALRALAISTFDAIVLDLTLPDSKELDTLSAVCAIAPRTPIIVLSGLEDEAIALRAVQSGAQDYLVKDKVSVDLLERAILYAIERKRGQEALSQEQYLLQTLLENSPDSIYFKDLQSRFIRISSSVVGRFHLHNWSAAIGKTDFDFFGADHAQQAFADEQRVIATGESIVGKEELETWPDGSENWVSTTKMPLRDQDGRIIGTFGVSRDISEQKRAQREISRLNERLERRVLERTEQLSQANSDLQSEILERQRTEDALRASNSSFSALFDQALDAILILNDEGYYVDANPAACALFERTRDELIGQSITSTALPEQQNLRLELFKKLIEGGELKTQMSIMLPDGSRREVDLNARANFTPGRHLSVLRDITERSHLEEERLRNLAREQRQTTQLRRLASASLAINEAIPRPGLLGVIAEQARALLGANLAVIDLHGNEVEMRTRSIARSEKYASVEDDDLAQIESFLRDLVGRRDSLVQLKVTDIDGSRTATFSQSDCLAAPLVGRESRALGVIYLLDRAEETQGEEDEAVLAQLVQVAASAIENSRLYRETQEAVRSREEVLTIVSHDLKNPLGVIQGYAQMLQRHATRSGIGEDRVITRSLSQIEGAVRRMGKQIEELLDFAKLQVGQPLDLSSDQVDLVALVTRMAAEHGRTTNRHIIRVETDLSSLTANYDEVRLERVIDNLLSNAIKYTPTNGDIVLSLDKQDVDGKEVAVMAVRDHGMGIPAEDLPHIFERFHRASNVTGLIPGTGIGLASTRHIIEQHGGTIAVSSEQGVGTTFTVCLPMRNA